MMVALLLGWMFLGFGVRVLCILVGGIGFGLFLDEIGMFVTKDNDYFFAPSAVIMYILVAFVLVLARVVRDARPPSAQESLANAATIAAEGVARGLPEQRREWAIRMVDRAQADGADPVTTASIRTVITARPAAPHVLVLTTYDTDADILAAIEAGAVGYLLKDAPPEELATAVRTAAAGKSALAPAIALRLMDRMRAPDAALSRREIEVLQLVADGHSNLQISQQLFLSQATVKSHLAHIYTKLAVDSRTVAVAAATTRGLIRR